MTTPLDGQIVLVTGAAKRIGRSIALYLGIRGAQVIIHYNESEQDAQRTADECGASGIVRANLESVAEIKAMFEEVSDRWGGLDSLVNNAARFRRLDPLEITEADWDYIHSVNLKATFFSCQGAARLMKAQESGGRIVNISSLGGIRPWPEHAHYCASKAGVIHMTRALARAWAPAISVNSVAPGVIPFAEKNDDRIQALVRNTPAQREGTGEEIAEAVAHFLTCSKFVTGQVLAVDGGLGLI